MAQLMKRYIEGYCRTTVQLLQSEIYSQCGVGGNHCMFTFTVVFLQISGTGKVVLVKNVTCKKIYFLVASLSCFKICEVCLCGGSLFRGVREQWKKK